MTTPKGYVPDWYESFPGWRPEAEAVQACDCGDQEKASVLFNVHSLEDGEQYEVVVMFETPINIQSLMDCQAGSDMLQYGVRCHENTHRVATTTTNTIADLATCQDYLFTGTVFCLQTNLMKMSNFVRI